MNNYGYAGKILKIDVSTGSCDELPTERYSKEYLGGRGIATKLTWDFSPPEASAFSPDNCISFVTGPLTGYIGLASSRTEICSRSPSMEPETFTYSNAGGGWGARLKDAGYDGLIIHGKAQKPSYCYIHDNKVEIRDAAELWGKPAVEAHYALKKDYGQKASIITIGPAGENLVRFAILFADENALATGGLGGVLGSKNIKAIVIVADRNKIPVANPDEFDKIKKHISQTMKPPFVPPVPWIIPGKTKDLMCKYCGIGRCTRQSYTGDDGYRYRSFCQGGEFYRKLSEKYYNKWTEAVLDASRFCDSYGVCSEVTQGIIEWMLACYNEGLMDDQTTGLPLSKIGSSEFIETLVKKISFREGFGDILAEGTLNAAEKIGGRAKEILGYSILTRANEYRDYDPRLLPTNALLFATESRRNVDLIHEASTTLEYWAHWNNDVSEGKPHSGPFTMDFFHESAVKYWGSVEAADFTNLNGKALAAKRIQDRSYARACTVLCSMHWSIFPVGNPDRILTDPNLVASLISAVTGQEHDEQSLETIGERVYNLQRAIMVRQGWEGRKGDILLNYVHEQPLEFTDINTPPPAVRLSNYCVPDIDGKSVSRKGTMIDREEFEKTKSEYYSHRGWDPDTGFQTKKKLNDLNLGDVADDLESRGLLITDQE